MSEERDTVDGEDIKALAFDVFGTVVDWRTPVIREARALGEAKGLDGVDWGRLADDWRGGYRPAMERVNSGGRPWTTLDVLNREILDEVAVVFGVPGLSNAEKDDLNGVWQRLDPWPDSASGLARLRERFLTAALSNGSMAMLANLSKHAGLVWDCVLSVELFKRYKPDPEVYRGAASLLALPTGNVMMVAAHKYDLKAAKSEGMQTALVSRPDEFGPRGQVDLGREEWIDLYSDDFHDLADKLGA